MTPALITDPRWRRRATWVLRAALAASWMLAAVVTHLPSPSGSGSDPTTQRAGRGIWVAAGELARALGAWVPDPFVELARPVASDKTIHLAISLVLAVLWLTVRAIAKGTSRRASLGIVLVLTGYAIVGELLQSVTGRIADLGDVIANAAGAMLGAGAVHVAVWLAVRYWMPSSQPKTMPISASSSA